MASTTRIEEPEGKTSNWRIYIIALAAIVLLGLTANSTFAALPGSEGTSQSAVAAPAGPLDLCGPNGQYVITQSTGAAIVPGDTLVPGSRCNECTTTVALPFIYQFYGQNFSSITVGDNGSLGFITNDNPSAGTCFPQSGMTMMAFPYLDDLTTTP